MTCYEDGVLVGVKSPMMVGRESALTQAELDAATYRGCNNIECEQCGKKVRVFDRQMVGDRSGKSLKDAYATPDFGGLLVTNEFSDAYRTYACACRIKMVSGVRMLAEERYDSDLYWSCAGHGSEEE